MLIEFRVENHRSIRDEQSLTLEAGRMGAPDDPRPRRVPGSEAGVLPAAALFGANASGKSNMLSALGFLRDAVLDSHSAWPPQGGVPRDAFAWGAGPTAPSTFEVTLLLGGVRHQYGFVLDQARVLEEWLFVWPKGRRQRWLEREGDRFHFGDHLGGENRSIEQVTRPNALFLSTAAQHQHEQLLPLHGWFQALRTVRVEGYRERYADAMPAAVAASMFAALAAASAAAATGASGMVRLNDLMPRKGEAGELLAQVGRMDARGTERLRQLLRAADVGIADFRVERPGNGAARGDPSRQILVRHDARSGEGGWLSLDRESMGTRALFQLGPAVFETLDRGGVLLVDELEASLHPLLAMDVLRLFNDPSTNPHAAQLLFTTHDASLLSNTVGEVPLRRDQIWLTEKDGDGATCVYPLTDFKPRKEENLERGYLQGRYGAVPLLSELIRWEG